MSHRNLDYIDLLRHCCSKLLYFNFLHLQQLSYMFARGYTVHIEIASLTHNATGNLYIMTLDSFVELHLFDIFPMYILWRARSIPCTVEPHLGEHPWDQVLLFAQLGSVRSPRFSPPGLFQRRLGLYRVSDLTCPIKRTQNQDTELLTPLSNNPRGLAFIFCY